jgi:hypothetical protein
VFAVFDRARLQAVLTLLPRRFALLSLAQDALSVRTGFACDGAVPNVRFQQEQESERFRIRTVG